MKLFIFQKLNYNHIFFIYYFIFCIIQAILEIHFRKEQAILNKYKRGHFYAIIILIIIFLSDFLSIIPFFIKKCLTNNNQKTKILNNGGETPLRNNDDYIYNNALEDEINKKSKNLKVFIFLVGLTDFIGVILYFLFYLDNDNDSLNSYSLFSYDVVFQIIILYILSAIILRTYFYKHHYLSIIINVISLICLITLDFINGYFEYLEMLLISIILVAFAIENAYAKKVMIYGYLSPFNLLIFRGIYKLIFLIIFLIIFIPIEMSIDNKFLGDIKVFNGIEILLAFLYFIFHFLKELFNVIIVDRFSPNHLALSLLLENIGYIISYIINYGNNNQEDHKPWEIFIRIFIYIIIFIAALIHNEIVIITKCGLGENTKLFMDEKAKEELLSNQDTDETIFEKLSFLFKCYFPFC